MERENHKGWNDIGQEEGGGSLVSKDEIVKETETERESESQTRGSLLI
jgi:hypothetical protein